MAAFPPETDFRKFASDVIGPDTRTLARSCREALLANWAASRPEEAAGYVAGADAEEVDPAQMEGVVALWAARDPGEAAAWLESAPAGAARDHGWLALVRHELEEAGPEAAWARTARIPDLDRQVEAATEVFHVWAASDRETAEAAWRARYSPGS